MVLFLLSLLAHAGPDRSGREVRVTASAPEAAPDLSVAYRGAGWTLHIPGVAVRAEWDVVNRTRSLTRPWRARPARVRSRELLVGLDVGASVHGPNDTLLPLQLVVGTRYIHRSGFLQGLTTGVFLHGGPALSVPNHPTYAIVDGALDRGWRGTRLVAAPGIEWEVGVDLSELDGHDAQVFARPTLSFLTPWSPGAVPVIAWDLGVRARLGRTR